MITLGELEHEPYEALARLRSSDPVAWLPAIHGWLVTRHDLSLTVMRDAATFTVDDPRFSTATVLGSSMLSLDGHEHDRHRRPFASSLLAEKVRGPIEDLVGEEARRLLGRLVADGTAELRTALAGPLAVDTIVRVLGLGETDRDEVRAWFDLFADAILAVTAGGDVPRDAITARERLRDRVAAAAADPHPSIIRTVSTESDLRPDEVVSNVAVVMFGAIETTEGMIANLLWHLLTHPHVLREVVADRGLIPDAIEESLRIEPAASVVDRYATRDIVVGDAKISRGDLVRVSLLAANRDPEVFADPDRFDIHRPDTRRHTTFVHGPHACLGAHLARVEASAAVRAVLDLLPEVALDPAASVGPRGLVFRKPPAVVARWRVPGQPG